MNLPIFSEAGQAVYGPGIYLIRASDGRCYIGQALHMLNRLRLHERRFSEGKANRIMQAAADSDEGLNLTFYVLEAYPGDGLNAAQRAFFAEEAKERSELAARWPGQLDFSAEAQRAHERFGARHLRCWLDVCAQD